MSFQRLLKDLEEVKSVREGSMIILILLFGVVASIIYGCFFGVRAAIIFWLGHILVVIVYAAQQAVQRIR